MHAQVVGEHGDSEVVLWSSARVGGVPLRDWPGWTAGREQEIATTVRTAGFEILRRKGATNHAIGLVTAALLRTLLRGERRIETVSRVHTAVPGVAHLDGLALSLPCILDTGGAVQVVPPILSDDEAAALQRSVEVLRGARASLDGHAPR